MLLLRFIARQLKENGAFYRRLGEEDETSRSWWW
jgi:hypothetical protein